MSPQKRKNVEVCHSVNRKSHPECPICWMKFGRNSNLWHNYEIDPLLSFHMNTFIYTKNIEQTSRVVCNKQITEKHIKHINISLPEQLKNVYQIFPCLTWGGPSLEGCWGASLPNTFMECVQLKIGGWFTIHTCSTNRFSYSSSPHPARYIHIK